MHILIEIAPLDPVTSTRTTLRVCSTQDRDVTGLNGVKWWPGIIRKPTQTIRLFDGDFSSNVDSGQASFDLQMKALAKLNANARRFIWAGASVTIYAGISGQAWPWSKTFVGRVDSFRVAADKLSITASVDEEPFSANVLSSTYAGTGGLEGGSDIKGKAKPWAFGAPRNVEPVLIDSVNSVFQVSAYGPILLVETLYERGSAFGTSFGDYANLTALVAANIPAGRWATCLASGLIRLGAPPYGVITADIRGDNQGGTWRRLPGAIIQRICSAAGISSTVINSTSLSALDTYAATLPSGGSISLYLTEQTDIISLARRIALTFNAQAGVSWLGQLFTTRVSITSPTATLDAQQKRLPRVTDAIEVDVSPPYVRIQMGGVKCWRVHTLDEIATAAQLIDKGQYDAATVYREGNIVTLTDGSRWEFVGATPLAGSAPSDSNANWARMADPVALPLGSNLVINSDFTGGLTGFSAGWDGTAGRTIDRGLNLSPSWSGVLNVAHAHAVGTAPAAGTVFDGHRSLGLTTSFLDSLKQYAVPVLPGDRLYFSMLAAGHRCTCYAILIAYDSAGTEISEASTPATTSGNFAGGDPANAQRIGAFWDMPANARYAMLETRALCPGGSPANDDPYMFWAQPFIAKVAPGQTTPPPYTSGPPPRDANLTADWATVSGGGKPQDNATVGAPTGTNVGSTPATTVEAGGNKANSGLDSSGNVLAGKVSTPSAAANAFVAPPAGVVGGGTFTHTGWTTRGSISYTPYSSNSSLVMLVAGVIILGDVSPAGTQGQVRLLMNGSTVIFGPIAVSRIKAAEQSFCFPIPMAGWSGSRTFELQYLATASSGAGDPHIVTDSTLSFIEGKSA